MIGNNEIIFLYNNLKDIKLINKIILNISF